MKKSLVALCVGMLLVLAAAPAVLAHFGMVIPEKPMVNRPGDLKFELLFWHPMENKGMELVKPAEAGVFVRGKKMSLLDQIKPVKKDGHAIWQGSYKVKSPGDYIIYMVPQPYWEPAEDCYIVHQTKVIVDALAAEEDWDMPVGLKMEIIPKTRPFGLYAGNSFTGQVLYKGKPLADAEVEVEYYNADGQKKPASELHVTQVVKSDANGMFTFTMPWTGWWGFAALHTDDVKIKHQGKDKDLELGGVLWLYAH